VENDRLVKESYNRDTDLNEKYAPLKNELNDGENKRVDEVQMEVLSRILELYKEYFLKIEPLHKETNKELDKLYISYNDLLEVN